MDKLRPNYALQKLRFHLQQHRRNCKDSNYLAYEQIPFPGEVI